MNTPENTMERWILNFTVQERERLRQLYLKSHSASESDFVRRAVELYADLYQRVLGGAKIVLRNEQERRQVNVSVPTHWNREDMPLPERETPRRNFELKIEGASKEQITQMVKAGAAPSAARLAWAAIGAYALIVEREQQGFVLKEERNGSFADVAAPKATQRSVEVENLRSEDTIPDAPRVLLSRVLEWEQNADITDFYIDAPFLTIDRWPNDRKQVIDVMTHNFKTKLTHYVYLLDKGADQEKLLQFIEDEFVAKLPWEAFDTAFHPELNRKVARLKENLKAKCKKSPVWALLSVGVLDVVDVAKSGVANSKLEHYQTRLFSYGNWYARLKDGSFRGFKFPQRNPPPSQEAFLNPMDPEEIKNRIKDLHEMAMDGIQFINVPEPLPSALPSKQSEAPAKAKQIRAK